MTRAQQTISLALLVTSVYLALAFNLVPLNAKIQEDIIPVVVRRKADSLLQLPLWTLVTFGSYLLFKLGWGVITFNDVPHAYKELMAEIEVARKDLKANGIDVD
ncbi:MAG: hypothetical protein Q9182_002434 [Xanthomendoza sp. 2 TL-2023]